MRRCSFIEVFRVHCSPSAFARAQWALNASEARTHDSNRSDRERMKTGGMPPTESEDCRMICIWRSLKRLTPAEVFSNFQMFWTLKHNVGITIINHPFGNGYRYQLSMVIWGMVCYCYTHLTFYYKMMWYQTDRRSSGTTMLQRTPSSGSASLWLTKGYKRSNNVAITLATFEHGKLDFWMAL